MPLDIALRHSSRDETALALVLDGLGHMQLLGGAVDQLQSSGSDADLSGLASIPEGNDDGGGWGGGTGGGARAATAALVGRLCAHADQRSLQRFLELTSEKLTGVAGDPGSAVGSASNESISTVFQKNARSCPAQKLGGARRHCVPLMRRVVR
jgi:hypothetical protein